MNEISIKVPDAGFTPVSNIFIDKYLKESRGEFIKVYIFCLRAAYGGQNLTIDKIASSLNLLQADVMKALEYWEEKHLMQLHPEGLIEFLPIVEDTKEDKIDEDFYNPDVKNMFIDIEKSLGRPISSKEMSFYLNLMDSYKFTPELLNILIEYCTSKKKTDIRYIEKVAMAWHENNIKDINTAQDYISKRETRWNKYKEILNFMGLKDQEIAKPQEDIMNKWLYTYKFSTDMIKEASRICVMRISEPNFSYIDAILSAWSKEGIKKITDIKKSTKKTRQRKGSNYIPGASSNQRQYDAEELERQLLKRGEVNEQ